MKLFRLVAAVAIMAFAGNPQPAFAQASDDGFEDPELPEIDLPEVDLPEVDAPEVEAGEFDDDAGGGELMDNHGGLGAALDDNPGASDRHGDSGGGHGEDDASESAEVHLNGPMDIEQGPDGREYVSGELLIYGPLADVTMARDNGFQVISQVQIGDDDRQMTRLLVPPGLSVADGVLQLRALTADSIVSINSAYRRTQADFRRLRTRPPQSNTPMRAATVGVIDTGVHASVRPEQVVASRGFGSSGYHAQDHGSAVVSIVTSHGVRVQVADVFGPTRTGQPYATASAIIAALQWMVEERVPVINISIEGPRNEILEQAVAAALRHGHIVVAAAGNGGPLADPAFPGAYEGVVAVTAVDQSGRAYLRANRGEYVDFAALGVQVPVNAGGRSVSVTGTSFAAPLVAAELAAHLPTPSPDGATEAVRALQARAIDRGRPGHDPIYGWGEVRSN